MKAALKIPANEQLAVFEELKDLLFDYEVRSVSELSGVSKATIYNWLEGKTRKPRLDTILKVAEALGYTLTLHRVGKAKTKPKHIKLVK